MDKQVLELCTFTLNDGVNQDDFLKASAEIEDFLREQDGFQYRSLCYRKEENLWVDVVYWENSATAAKATDDFMNDSRAKRFLELIDMPSVCMRHAGVEQTVNMCEEAAA